MKRAALMLGVIISLGLASVANVSAGEGHDAGYRWAEQHDIDDPSYSNGNSESFNEGVRQYVEDNYGGEE